MQRRRVQMARIGLGLAALLGTSAVSSSARADDDIISLQGLSPELLGALGGSMSPEMLAALMAAAGGTRAAQGSGTPAAGPRVPGMPDPMTLLPGGGDPNALSSMLEGVSVPGGGGAPGSTPGPTGTGGAVVDVHHPGETHDPVAPRRGPERIGRGRAGGLVELHPSADDPSAALTEPAVEPSRPTTTTLPPVRVGSARRSARPRRTPRAR